MILLPQSGNIVAAPTDQAAETVQFDDQYNPYIFDASAELESTRMLQDMSDANLDTFFSRPVKIYHEAWTIGSTTNATIDPWALYFRNKRVVNRINNYSLLRANLHLKIVLNGNSFYYGRMMASYLPFGSIDPLANSVTPYHGSQRPHIFLDPCTSAGGEMKLPFFYDSNYLSIIGSEWDKMGRLSLIIVNPLKHANGGTENVSICVFAWATEVSYSIPTSVNSSSLVAQSGEIEQAPSGIISGPASAIASAAGALTRVPAIGPYAVATQRIATTIGNLAKIFGYSRPPDIRQPSRVNPTMVSHLATCDAPDTTDKLTVDSKQELSIDPRIAGVPNEDTLSILSIAKREAMFSTFPWAISALPETLLFNVRVTPLVYTDVESDGKILTPCAVATLPFEYWTGTLKYRFQIVCSSFHRGRLKIVYDPSHLETNEYNVNYMQIVDIANEKDFTIEIGPAQPVSLMTVLRPPCEAPATNIYRVAPYLSPTEWGNGILSVFVLNELTTPNTVVNNDIEINVFVSAGDDFEVFVPQDDFRNLTLFPQSGMVVPEAEMTSSFLRPEMPTTYRLGPVSQDNSKLSLVFAGERITSMRQLLKRYTYWRTDRTNCCICDPGTTQRKVRRTSARWFPFYRGAAHGAVDTSSMGPYNYVNTLLMHIIVSSYCGFRGGIRYKIVPNASSDRMTLLAERWTALTGYETELSNFDDANLNVVLDMATKYSFRPHGYNGATVTSTIVNGSLEFEVPYYLNKRFTLRYDDWTSNAYPVFSPGYTYWVDSREKCVQWDIFTAVAEDFQTYFWAGLPVVYFNPTNVAP